MDSPLTPPPPSTENTTPPTETWKTFFKKRWVKISLGVFVGMLVLLLTLSVLAVIYEDKIAALVIKELNKSLRHEATIGTVDLTLLRTFPDAAVTLHNVKIPDTHNKELLTASQLSLRFGAMSLLSNHIKIYKILIADGSLHVKIDRKGRPNYDIFKPSKGETSESGSQKLSFSIRDAFLENVKVGYENRSLRQNAAVAIEKLSLSGDFSLQQFVAKSYGEMQVERIETKEGELLSGRRVAYEADVEVDLEHQEFRFKENKLYVESNTFLVNGIVQTDPQHTDFDLELAGVDCSLQSVLSLVPKGRFAYLEDFDTRGNFYAKATLKGRLSGSEQPAIDFEFGLKDGYLNSNKIKQSLKNVSFIFRFQNKEKSSDGKDFIELTDFNAVWKDQPLRASFFMQNLADPYIDLRFEGEIPLKEGFGLLNNPQITDGDGFVRAKGLIIEGKYEDMISLDRVSRVQANGTIDLSGFMLRMGNEVMEIPKGEVYVSNNDLTIKDLRFEGLGSDFRLKGQINNALPVLLRDSTNLKNVVLEFDADLAAAQVDLNRIVDFVWNQQTAAPSTLTVSQVDSVKMTTASGSASLNLEDFTKILKGRFKANFETVKYDKIEAKNAKGILEFQNNLLIVKGVEVEAMDGKFTLTSNLFLEKKPYLRAFVTAENINGRQFFEQMDNFGQSVLTAQNISGKLHTNLLLDVYWDEKGNFLMDKLYALADVVIENGELNNFEMLRQFSKFIKIEELNNIKFKELKNQLEIKNKTLYLPAMFIESSLANLTIAGTHGFDLHFDYKIKVNAGDAIKKRFAKSNPKQKTKKAKKKGWFNVYVSVFGNVDKYDFSYSKKEIKETLEADLQRQFVEIQNNIQTEFQTPPLLEPIEWENDPDSTSVE